MEWLDVEKNKRFPVPSCGKSDFRDTLIMHQADGSDASVDAFLAKTDVYIGRAGPLRLDHFEDCIPYLHHLISVGSFNKSNGRNYICLTEDSFIDSAEKGSVEIKIEHIETYKSSDVTNKSFERFTSSIGIADEHFDLAHFDNYMLKKYYDTPFDKDYYITSRATYLRAQLLRYALDNNVDICSHSELTHQLKRFLYYYIHTSKFDSPEQLYKLIDGLKERNIKDIMKIRDLMEEVL